MKGFDPKFADFPDYILGITKEIWEDRQISTLHQYYGDEIVVRSPASVVVGNENVIGATMATLAEFPDRELLGEDVIWCGTPEAGLLSSHRLISTATHTRDGAYGTASGRRLHYRILADCHAMDNQINDEWLVRDQGAIARQLGMTPEAYAGKLILDEGGPGACVKPLTPERDLPGPYTGRGNDDPFGQRHAEVLTRIMGADMAAIETEYDRGVALELPGGVSEHGRKGADRFWMSLRAAFPNAAFSVDHAMGNQVEGRPPRSAVRWSLWGRHSGWGGFGVPTGAMVYVLGISHVEWGALVSGQPPRILREHTLIDETAIWKQILLHQTAPS